MGIELFASILQGGDPKSIQLLRCISERGYVVFRRDGDASNIAIQVSAGRQVDTAMGGEGQQWLYDQGFRRKRASENFSWSREIDAWSAQDYQAFVQSVFSRCFGGVDFAVTLLSLPKVYLANEMVLDAMRHLAKVRDWSARKTLYRLLIDADFLVPMNEENVPKTVDKIGSFPVCAIFTDQNLFLKATPLGHAFEVIQGKALFPILAAKRFGSMRINPGTEVRGELYLNELQTLVQGIERLAAHYSG